MSALAKWYLNQGWTVTGSDLSPSLITEELVRMGVMIKKGHKAQNLPKGATLVIYTAAAPDDNPELAEAKKRGMKAVIYSAALGELTKLYKTLAVTGSHGKSTTTALLALALIKGRFDPTVIIGTRLKEFGGSNFRAGKSDNMVIEADEWHASFLDYSPAAIVLTNVDKEHLDFYENFSAVKNSFLKFIGKISCGIIVANADDAILVTMRNQIEKVAKKHSSRVIWYSVTAQSRLTEDIKKSLKIFGDHNLSNALGAYTLAIEFGVPHSDVLAAFQKYDGSWRRMEARGRVRSEIAGKGLKSLVFDDYGHHPTEIRATLRAFRERYPKSQIVCVFQPHQAHRLKVLFGDFRDAFRDADFTILLPSYQVVGRDSGDLNKNAEALVKAMKRRHPKDKIMYVDEPRKIPETLKVFFSGLKNVDSPPLVIMMGAGDIASYTQEILV